MSIDNKKLRRVMIVIEETGEMDVDANGKPGPKFILYMAGDTERLNKIPDEKLSAAEFWGFRLFQICVGAVKNAGAFKGMLDRQ